MRPSTARSRNLETGKEGLLEDASARWRAPIKDEGWCQMMVPETVGCGVSCAEGNGRRQQMMDQNFGMKEHHCLCWPRNCVAVLTQQGKHSPPSLKVGDLHTQDLVQV